MSAQLQQAHAEVAGSPIERLCRKQHAWLGGQLSCSEATKSYNRAWLSADAQAGAVQRCTFKI